MQFKLNDNTEYRACPSILEMDHQDVLTLIKQFEQTKNRLDGIIDVQYVAIYPSVSYELKYFDEEDAENDQGCENENFRFWLNIGSIQYVGTYEDGEEIWCDIADFDGQEWKYCGGEK